MSDSMRFLRPFFLFYTIHSLELCSFDEGTCQWNIEPPWNVVSLALLPSHPNLLTAPNIITSEGPFLLAQGKYASIVTAQATSQKLSKSDHMRILAYRYQRRGSAILRISIKTNGHEVLLDTISSSEPERDKWHRRSVILPPVLQDDGASIVFECDGIRTAQDVLAIDDVDLATPENVMWAGQDSKFFDEEDIRRREIRRSSKLSKSCPAVSCQFRSSACAWQGSNIQLLPTKVVNEAAGESTLTSPPFHLPDGSSNLQIQIFDSSGSSTSVHYRTVGSLTEKKIWKKKLPATTSQSNGWVQVNIPLNEVPSGIPIILIVRSMTGPNDFVAFSSFDLVDDNFKKISCDKVTAPVQPHSGELIRLTALQNLKMSPIESLLYQPPISSLTTVFPITVPPTINFSLDDKPKFFQAPVAVLPIAPAHVSARGIPIVPISSFSSPLIPFNFQKPSH